MIQSLTLKRTGVAVIAAAMLLAAALLPAATAQAATNSPRPTETIEDIVLRDDGQFDVLQAAVVKAGLVGVLDGNKNYTVFAPTDGAFVSSLGVANEDEAISTINGLSAEAVKNIVLYHVKQGRLNSTAVSSAPSYKMANGDRLTRAEVLDAGIAMPDVKAKNGIVHVINAVLMP